MANDAVFSTSKAFLWKMLVFKRNAHGAKKMNDTFSEI